LERDVRFVTLVRRCAVDFYVPGNGCG